MGTIESQIIFVTAFGLSIRNIHTKSWNSFCEAVEHPEWKVKVLTVDMEPTAKQNSRFQIQSTENKTVSGFALAAFNDEDFCRSSAGVIDDHHATVIPPKIDAQQEARFKAMYETALNKKGKPRRR